MKTTKRTFWKLLIVCAALCMSIGGTIAYLTDSDGDVNVMTLGRVEIDLIEQERTDNGTLGDFQDDHPLIPGVYQQLDSKDEQGFWPESVHNAVDKIVTVKNIGPSDAYVRLWFAFEVTGEQDFFEKKLHLNKNDNETEWKWQDVSGTLEQNGEKFVVAVATCPNVLNKDSSTPVSLRQVLLDSSATNEDVAALGEKYSILVVAQGVQAAGFDSAEQALNAGFGAVSINNHPFEDMDTGESYVQVTKAGLDGVLNNTTMGGKANVVGVTFGRYSEYEHIIDGLAQKPVTEEKTGALPMLFATAYADEEGAVTAYYVPSENEPGKYHVYILSEGSIKLPKDCDELLGDFGNLKVFTATNLDASDVEHMKNLFKGCNNLTVVKIPDGMTIVPEDMFTNCDKLEVIEFPESVEKVEINPNAFTDKKENVYLIVVPGSPAEQWGQDEGYNTTNWPFTWWNMGDYIHITKYIGTAAEVEVPAEIEGLPVEVLGSNAFAAMEHLDIVTSVKLPETLRRADYGVFIDCDKLRSINIPASLRYIPQDFLCMCDSLESITIPEGVIKIESGAFSGCEKLKSVTLPSTVSYIGYNAFAQCPALTEIDLPRGIQQIGATAFGQTGITRLTIPDTVIRLDDSALQGMDNLQELTIPASVEHLGMNCLPTGVTLRVTAGSAAAKYCETHALPYTLADGTVVPPTGSAQPPETPGADPEDASCFTFWDNGDGLYIDGYNDEEAPLEVLVVPEWLDGKRVRVIGTGAFASKEHLKTATLPDGLREIKQTAFVNDWQLTSINIPDSVTNIGQEAFAFCSELVTVNIPTGIMSLNDSVFRGCHSLKEITIPGNVLYIDREAFYDCFSLEKVTIQEGVCKLADKVFANCSNLKEINIPKSVTSIGKGILEGCPFVQVTVYQNTAGHRYCVDNGIPYHLMNDKGEIIQPAVPTPVPDPTPAPDVPSGPVDDTEWHEATDEIPFTWYKRDGYAGIQHYAGTANEVVVPAELGGVPVRVLGKNAFAAMKYIHKVTLPETLTTIEGWVFPDASNLYECNIPAGVTSIGDGAFFGCNALQSVTIPKGVTQLLESTFGWCESLQTVTIPGNVKKIDQMVFHDCHGLTEVVIEEGVETIGAQAFYNCISLQSIIIPQSVKEMGADVFMGCGPQVVATVYENSAAHDYCMENAVRCTVLNSNGDVIATPAPEGGESLENIP